MSTLRVDKLESSNGGAIIIEQAATLTELRSMNTLVTGNSVTLLTRDGAMDLSAGLFSWDPRDLSAEVTLDTLSGIYVAPNSDLTGTSGAWVRQYSGNVNAGWFGATPVGSVEEIDPEITGSEVLFDAGFDSGPAISACWQWVIDNGGGEPFLPSGLYKTSVTLPMDSGLVPKGEGYASTQIRLTANANVDVIKSRDFDTYFNTDSWIVDTTDIPWGYGLIGICIDGNRDNNTTGYGWKCYGKLRVIENCMFKNCYQWGWLNAAGTSVGQSDFRDSPEAKVWMICRGNRVGGMWAFGPHDMMYEHVISAFNGRDANDWDIIIEDDGVMSGGGRFKFLHTYGGPASGIWLKNIGVVQGDHMIAENGCLSQGSGGYWNLIQNGSASYGTALRVEGGGYLVGKMRLSTNDPTHDGFYLDGADFQVANLRLQGDVGSTGTGIQVRSDGFKCGTLRILQFDTGLVLGPVAAVNNCFIGSGDISSCNTAFSYPSAGQRNDITLNLNVDTGEVAYSGVSPDDSDNLDLIVYGLEDKRTKRTFRINGAIDATGQVTVSFDPKLVYAPDLGNISVSVVGASTSTYSLDYEPRVNGTPTSSNIDIRYDVGVASAGGGVIRIAVVIDESSGEELA